MPRRQEDVAVIKGMVQELAGLQRRLPSGYDGLRSALASAQSTARRDLGTLLADLELER